VSKARTDAQGRRFDAEGRRVYDKAGKNTWVEAIHPGVYPANHFRPVGSKFQLAEGHGIVDWMAVVEDEAPRKAARAKPVLVAAAATLPAEVEQALAEAAGAGEEQADLV
jgi:hypothetical protein